MQVFARERLTPSTSEGIVFVGGFVFSEESLGIASTGRDTICKLTGKASVLCKMFILKLHGPFLALLKIWETTPHGDNTFY